MGYEGVYDHLETPQFNKKYVHYYYTAKTNGEDVYVDTETFFAYWG